MSVKPALIDAIKDVIDELETVYDGVAKNARDHIHAELKIRLHPARPSC